MWVGKCTDANQMAVAFTGPIFHPTNPSWYISSMKRWPSTVVLGILSTNHVTVSTRVVTGSELPKLQNLPLPQQMTGIEENCCQLRQDIELGEILEQKAPPPDILMEDAGQWVRLGPALPVEQEGPPLLYFRWQVVQVEDSGATAAHEDGIIVGQTIRAAEKKMVVAMVVPAAGVVTGQAVQLA